MLAIIGGSGFAEVRALRSSAAKLRARLTASHRAR